MKARTIFLGILFLTVIFACEKEELELLNPGDTSDITLDPTNDLEFDILYRDSLEVHNLPQK